MEHLTFPLIVKEDSFLPHPHKHWLLFFLVSANVLSLDFARVGKIKRAVPSPLAHLIAFMKIVLLYLFAAANYYQIPQIWGVSSRKWTSHNSVGYRFKSKLLAGLTSSATIFLDLQVFPVSFQGSLCISHT